MSLFTEVSNRRPITPGYRRANIKTATDSPPEVTATAIPQHLIAHQQANSLSGFSIKPSGKPEDWFTRRPAMADALTPSHPLASGDSIHFEGKGKRKDKARESSHSGSSSPEPMDGVEPSGSTSAEAKANVKTAADLHKYLAQPKVKQAIQADKTLSRRMENNRERAQAKLTELASQLASEPAWIALITGEKEASQAEIHQHMETIDGKLVTHLKDEANALTKAHQRNVSALMGQRTRLAQLTPNERLQRGKLEIEFHTQLAVLQTLADHRMILFQQAQGEALEKLAKAGKLPGVGANSTASVDEDATTTEENTAGSNTDKANESNATSGVLRKRPSSGNMAADRTTVQSILNDPGFQEEEEGYQKKFKDGLKAVILGVVSDPEWTKGVSEGSAAVKKAHTNRLNEAISGYMKDTVNTLSEHFNEKMKEALGQDESLKNKPVSELPADTRQKVLRLQLQMQNRQAFLQQFNMQAYFQKVHAEAVLGQQAIDTPGLKARLAAMSRLGGKEFGPLIARCRSKEADVRASGFKQLLAVLQHSTKPNTERLLKQTIRAIADVPLIGALAASDAEAAEEGEESASPTASAMEMKLRAAAAIMHLPDDKDKTQLMHEWLNSDRIENRIAALKLFSFGLGPVAGATAYRLLEETPSLRDSLTALRKIRHEAIQDSLGLVDQYFATRKARQERAQNNTNGQNRLFSAPKSSSDNTSKAPPKDSDQS